MEKITFERKFDWMIGNMNGMIGAMRDLKRQGEETHKSLQALNAKLDLVIFQHDSALVGHEDRLKQLESNIS